MSAFMKLLVTLLLALLPGWAAANDWAALKEPGAHAIMRHALAPGTGDPANFDVEDCSTQRNLDARGRAQARALGEALRARDISFDRVLSSAWCRSFDTAELMALGTPEITPALNSFFRNRERSAPQTEALREIIAAAEGPLLMVTHQVNITALTGQWVDSGEVFVIRETDDGIEITGRILIAP
jgi:broad specificity phosphatase PhoE